MRDRITTLRWLEPGQRFQICGTGMIGFMVKTNECRAVVRIDGKDESISPGTEVVILAGIVETKIVETTKDTLPTPTKSKVVAKLTKTPVVANPLGKCLCGCGEQTSGSKFKPGHDARFHGRIKRIKSGKLTLDTLKTEIGKTNYAISAYETALASHK